MYIVHVHVGISFSGVTCTGMYFVMTETGLKLKVTGDTRAVASDAQLKLHTSRPRAGRDSSSLPAAAEGQPGPGGSRGKWFYCTY